MGSTHVQIVEGNPHLRSLLGWHLQQAGYVIHLSASLHQARGVFQSQQSELMIVDSDLPDGSGVEFCRWLRRQQQILIFILSAQTSEVDIVAGLKAGADDYLRKPFGIQEFLARVEALVRRSRPAPSASLNYGELKVNLVQRRVHYQGEPIDLTPQEFSLLYVLAQAGGAALNRLELLHRAWPDTIDNPRTVDTHVLSLRKKIERDPQQPHLLQTVRNVGYRLNIETSSQSSNRQASTVAPITQMTDHQRKDPARSIR